MKVLSLKVLSLIVPWVALAVAGLSYWNARSTAEIQFGIIPYVSAEIKRGESLPANHWISVIVYNGASIAPFTVVDVTVQIDGEKKPIRLTPRKFADDKERDGVDRPRLVKPGHLYEWSYPQSNVPPEKAVIEQIKTWASDEPKKTSRYCQIG